MADIPPTVSTDELIAETHAMVARLRALLHASEEALRQQDFRGGNPHTTDSEAAEVQTPASPPPPASQQ